MPCDTAIVVGRGVARVDLDRSVEFYEKTFPVQRWGRINGPVQSYLGPVETWDMGEFDESKVVIFRDPDGIMLKLIE